MAALPDTDPCPISGADMPTKSGMEPGADEEKLRPFDAQLAPYQIFKTVVHDKFSPFAMK
jgi:hypothetical protein